MKESQKNVIAKPRKFCGNLISDHFEITASFMLRAMTS